MGVKSDRWIREMALKRRMIEPFEPRLITCIGDCKVISYGTSSYGYDVRCADEFKVFTNINSTIVDPKNFDPKSFVDVRGEVCIIPPNSFALARTIEYFRIPRDVLAIALSKSTYARCFRGDTRVALVDGTCPTLEEMAERADREIFFGYSVGPFGKVIVAQLVAPRYIGRDNLIEITLEGGKKIHCTPDHRFLTREGEMVEAERLSPKTGLMPFSRGSQMVDQPPRPDDGRFLNGERLRCRSVRPPRPRSIAKENRFHGPPFQHSLSRSSASKTETVPRSRSAIGIQTSPVQIESIRRLKGEHDVYCLTAPETGNFALQAGVFASNCGIIVNTTPLHPEWEGHLTLELSNTTPLPAKIYAGEGIAQLIFISADEVCEISYRDRGGKYMGQIGVTLPKP